MNLTKFYFLESCTYFGDEKGGCIGSDDSDDDFCYFGSEVMQEIQSKIDEINSNKQEILKSYFEKLYTV